MCQLFGHDIAIKTRAVFSNYDSSTPKELDAPGSSSARPRFSALVAPRGRRSGVAMELRICGLLTTAALVFSFSSARRTPSAAAYDSRPRSRLERYLQSESGVAIISLRPTEQAIPGCSRRKRSTAGGGTSAKAGRFHRRHNVRDQSRRRYRHCRFASAWARRNSSMTALISGGSRNRPTRPPTPPPACRLRAVSACS
jgi:hypothetical protein